MKAIFYSTLVLMRISKALANYYLQGRCITIISWLCDHIQKRLVNIKDHMLETWKVSQSLRCGF